MIVSIVSANLFMTLLWFQETLTLSSSFFGDRYRYDMDTIMKHRQVVILICGLMSDPSPVMHYVCRLLDVGWTEICR